MQTMPGAFITIILNLFQLFVIIQSTIAMVTYAEMAVENYTVV